MVLQRNQILLVAGIMFALAAGMLLGLTTGVFKGPQVAHAQIAQVSGDKSDTGDGTYARGEEFEFILTFTVASQTSEIVEYNDLLPPEIEFAFPSIDPTVPPLFCTAGLNNVNCELPIGTPIGSYSVTVNVRIASTAECGPVTNILRTGPVEGQGTFSADETIEVVDCVTPVQPVFELCKEWDLQGAVAAPRDFRFDVTDSSGTEEVVIPNVVEGGPEACILVSAAPGGISVEEIGVDGFDEPDWYFDGNYADTDHTANFFLFDQQCEPLEVTFLVERLVEVVTGGVPSCTITFVNEDNDTPTVTTTPVTTTPTIVVCVLCNRTVTPPPATSTPTTPATATAPSTQPPSTQPPANTVTPTTVGGQAPGLTDEQRTATAVAGARTAAAQATPIAPRTGGGAMGGAGGALNIALLAAGLIVLSSGLSLVAVRGRRS